MEPLRIRKRGVELKFFIILVQANKGDDRVLCKRTEGCTKKGYSTAVGDDKRVGVMTKLVIIRGDRGWCKG